MPRRNVGFGETEDKRKERIRSISKTGAGACWRLLRPERKQIPRAARNDRYDRTSFWRQYDVHWVVGRKGIEDGSQTGKER
jgi:hypothetical protein